MATARRALIPVPRGGRSGAPGVTGPMSDTRMVELFLILTGALRISSELFQSPDASVRCCCPDSANRPTGIVATVGRLIVTFVSLALDAGIELKPWDIRDFVREFILCLPHYPVRRAARIYHNSTLSKSDSAAAELRRLLAQ